MDKPINSFLELFELQVKENSETIAATFYDETLTYKELDEKSNQFANYLLSTGLPNNALVGVYLERSLNMLISMLGILKAGATYVPLDPIYPKDRLVFMLEDTNTNLVITSSAFEYDLKTTIQKISIDKIGGILDGQSRRSPGVEIDTNDLAYIIYTSGSTGQPKGAQIEHGGLLNFIEGILENLNITRNDVILGLSTISFDISILELFLPLTVGAKIVLVDSNTRLDGNLILDVLKSEKITVFQATPVTWRMVLEAGWGTRLPIKALCGGEAFPIDLANRLLELCNEVWNLYGPTETTVWAMAKKVEKTNAAIPIGRPINNVDVYILNEQLAPVGIGEVGEIYIGGAGVGRGYLNRPQLNQEVFIANPFVDNHSKIYKTGDLGMASDSGEIQYLGRVDHQVKIRGFRVELGEIEKTISLFRNIKQNCVHYWNQKYPKKQLVAYLVLEDDVEIDIAELIDFLRNRLPDYMIPVSFLAIKSFPLTESGKINRKALPVPIREKLKPSTETPTNLPTQLIVKVVTILEDAAGFSLKGVSFDSNFIQMGFDSLTLSRVAFHLRKEFNLPISFRMLNETHDSINLLVSFIRQHDQTVIGNAVITENPIYNQTLDSCDPITNHELINNLQIQTQQIISQLKILSKQVTMLQQALSSPKADIPQSRMVRIEKNTSVGSFEEAPIPGARLGKTKSGDPAWFIEDKENLGKYLHVTT